MLGAIGRTGPIVWQLPHSANLTLRQLGTVLFLAGIGVNAGDAFGDTILSRDALGVIAAAVVVAATASVVTVLIGALVLHLPVTALTGIVSGMQTQPAVLAYASEQTDDDTEVNVGVRDGRPARDDPEDRAGAAAPAAALVAATPQRSSRSTASVHTCTVFARR